MIFLETIQQLEACCPSPDNKNCSGAFQIKLDMNHNSITHTHETHKKVEMPVMTRRFWPMIRLDSQFSSIFSPPSG